jgi:hypothetical protein
MLKCVNHLPNFNILKKNQSSTCLKHQHGIHLNLIELSILRLIELHAFNAHQMKMPLTKTTYIQKYH